MGKYMKKSKLTPGIAVMELSSSSSPGRLPSRAAKTLALHRLNKSRPVSSSSYLQLRSRRLEKLPVILRQQQQHKTQQDAECCRNSAGLECSSASLDSEKRTESGRDVEDCFGENWLEFGETAGKVPSSLVRNSSFSKTSHSTRMETNSRTTTNSRVEIELLKSIPTPNDIEEFFAHEELWNQRTFIKKYNFDFASEMPLQGRYKWVQVHP